MDVYRECVFTRNTNQFFQSSTVQSSTVQSSEDQPSVSQSPSSILAIKLFALIITIAFTTGLSGCDDVFSSSDADPSPELESADSQSEVSSGGSAIVEFTSAEMREMQWTLDNDGGYIHQTSRSDEESLEGGSIDVDMNASLAWTITEGSRDIVVGILDSGIDYNHPDLVANLWRNEIELNGVAGVDDDGNGYVDDIYGINTTVAKLLESGELNPTAGDPLDQFGHGTMVAGVIGAVGDNDIGISGVSPKVSIVTCKGFSRLSFFGAIFPNLDAIGPSHDSIIQCMEYFAALKESGVNLVATNHSYASSRQAYVGGMTFPTESKYRYDTDELKAAIQRHGELDILFVTGAGNAGLEIYSPLNGRVLFKDINDNDKNGGNKRHALYPSSFNLPNMISVAGIVNTGEVWVGTSFGRFTADVFAGSDRVLSTWPTYTKTNARGEQELAVPVKTYSPAPGYVMAMGTSFSAPQVVGLAALIKSADQYAELTAVEIKNLILAGAVAMDELCDYREGSGIHECLSGDELLEKSLTGRMIRAADSNGAGALTCSERNLTRRQLPMLSEVTIKRNTGSVDLEVLNILCHEGAGDVAVTVSFEDEVIEELLLVDDGENGDLLVGDGVYSLQWEAPSERGDYVIDIAGEQVTVTVK